MCLTPIDALQELIGVTLFLEVNQILVISVDPHICVWSPCSLYFFSCELIFCFEFNFFLSLKIASPCPLNLNSCNMVHSKPMILEKSPSQTHLVSSLYECCTEVSQALVLVLVHHVERRSQELLTEVLGGWQVAADFGDRLVYHSQVVCRRLTVGVLLRD